MHRLVIADKLLHSRGLLQVTAFLHPDDSRIEAMF
jgi:hypothetical protein